MQNRTNNRTVIFMCFGLCILLLIGERLGLFVFAIGGVQQLFSPVFGKAYQSSELLNNAQIKQLRQQNQELQTQLAKDKEIAKDNKALRDQFQTTNPSSQKLLPAHIVGSPNYLPGFSSISILTIDKGQNDGIVKGQAVIYKDNFVGQVTSVSSHLSIVTVVSNNQTSFAVTTAKTNALGVLKGQGDYQMILDNVVLSDTLQKNDLVVTKGSINANGSGLMPNLIVGKIVAVNKKASNVFQTADVESLIDFSRLTMVFVVLQNQ